MSYFPPFKMFFLLCALVLLVDSGLNIRFENRYTQKQKAVTVKLSEREADSVGEQERKQKAAIEDFNGKLKRIFEWTDEHTSVVTLLFLLLFSCPLWLLFRHSPAIPDLRLSECFIAMVYISNMLLLYSLVPSFFCFNTRAEGVYGMLTLLLINIPIKQLTGYGYWSTIWRVFLAATSLVIVLGALIVFSIYLYIILVYA